MKRTTEFVLGLIGGIFGILCAFIALFIGGSRFIDFRYHWISYGKK